nr:transposase (putative), gypsy type [Tanacetum cinerariifolium]
MGRDTVQLETAVNTISQEYLLEFTSEYGIPKTLHPELPGPEDRIIDFPEGKVDERVFPTVVDWRTNAPKDGMPAESTYSIEAVRALDTHRTPIQKQPKMLLCVVGISRRYYLGDEVYPTFLYDDDRDMDLFNLIRVPNPTKVKTGSRPRAPHEVPLLTLTANRVIEMDDPATVTDSLGVSSTIERFPLDFSHEAGASDQGTAAPEMSPSEDVPATDAPEAGQVEEAATDPLAATESRSAHGGKSLAAIQLGLASTRPVAVPENAPAGVSDPDPLSFADPPSSQGTAAAGDPDSENASSSFAVGSSKSIYRPELEQEAKLLRKSVAQVARRDKKIQARELEIKNLEALLEAETNVKKAAEDRSAGLSQELEDMRARYSDLQVSNDRLFQQVATLQEQVSEEDKLKAAFEEFKRYEDDRVEQRCEEMEARLDALSIDFDKELYPHMLTAIAGRRWAFADVVSAGIAKGMSEGLRHRVEHGWAQLSLESIKAYDLEAEAKYVVALQAMKDLKYPLVDQLEVLKDAPMDVLMAALYLESDTGNDAPQYIRDLRPSSSKLTIPVYLEVRDPRNPWAFKEEMLLADAIAANISRAEKNKKCRIVCRTNGVGSAHHARSNGVPVSVPTIVHQGLALLLADAATQTELE